MSQVSRSIVSIRDGGEKAGVRSGSVNRPRRDTQIFYIAPSDFGPYGSEI